MALQRRQFLRLAAGAASLPALSRIAGAQAYPARPVRIIVAASAGGATDITARLIGQWLSDRLGQSFLIENRPGANNTIGTGAVVRAPADGYTLLMANTVDAINASLYQKLNYNFIRDIAPVARIAFTPLVLVVHPALPARSIPEFIAYAMANPGKLTFGSGGLGSPINVTGELFKMKTGISFGQVQYRGSAPALADLLGGQVQAMFPVIAEAIEYIRAGNLRALAVTSAQPSDVLPNIPIMADYVPGLEAGIWFGIAAPKGTPAAVIDRLNKEINTGLADPGVKARFADLGASLVPGSSAEFESFIGEETDKWAKVVKFAGIKAE
jgi:tripartite-type tricarboxylate transporter receptor subunit TctC